MFEFETEVDVNVIGGHQVVGGGGKAKVKWVMTIEAREYGIKCFGIYVPEQTVLASITKYDEETDEEYKKRMKAIINHVNHNGKTNTTKIKQGKA